METVIEQAWSKSKILIKGIVIGIIVLLLLIPTYFVTNLIEEREERQKEAITEVSSKWAGRQTITGPIVVIPYQKTIADTANKVRKQKHYAYFLPGDLTINTILTPQERSRGIYKVMLYTAAINITGNFNGFNLEELNINGADALWNEAYVKLNITDVRGLNEEVKLKWDSSSLLLTAQTTSDVEEGLGSSLPMLAEQTTKKVQFSSTININGSEQLLFTPIGKTTMVQVSSKWPHPSFSGTLLPHQSQISDSGFTATWKSFAHKRSFPQSWTSEKYQSSLTAIVEPASTQVQSTIETSAFGTDLFIPVNGYQKTMRSIKYAALCILLTFAAFFLIETVNKKSIHPFQYALIGLALVLFYVLLLSFSEYTGFTFAYFIASAATILLIGWFAKGLLESGKLSSILAIVLSLVYVYVFTILQLQDFALLLGSIGLFISLAIIMYFSKKIKW